MNIAIDRRFMMRHPAHVIALGFGAGLSLWAPGTVGTLWAWLAWLIMQPWLSPLAGGVGEANTVSATFRAAGTAGLVRGTT